MPNLIAMTVPIRPIAIGNTTNITPVMSLTTPVIAVDMTSVVLGVAGELANAATVPKMLIANVNIARTAIRIFFIFVPPSLRNFLFAKRACVAEIILRVPLLP